MHSIASPYLEKASSGIFATNSCNIARRVFFWSLIVAPVLYGLAARRPSCAPLGETSNEREERIGRPWTIGQGQARQRFALRNGRSRPACHDESSWQASRRPRHAPGGYRRRDRRQPPFKQLRRHGLG